MLTFFVLCSNDQRSHISDRDNHDKICENHEKSKFSHVSGSDYIEKNWLTKCVVMDIEVY